MQLTCYRTKISSNNSYRQGKITSSTKNKLLNKTYICGKHKNADKSCDDFIVVPVLDKLPNGCSPTGKQVLGYLF